MNGNPGDPPVHRHASLDSTNSEALRLGESGAPHHTVVVAEYQSAGRGQMDRRWLMPRGQGVLLSILLRETPPGAEFAKLTLRVGRAVADLLGRESGLRIEIKAPNDLMIEGKKVAGILSEARWRGEDLLFAVVGVGINVNVLEFPPEISDSATSLALAAGREFDLERLIQGLILCLRSL